MSRREDGCGGLILLLFAAMLIAITIAGPTSTKEEQLKEYKAWVKYTGRDDISFEEYKLIKKKVR